MLERLNLIRTNNIVIILFGINFSMKSSLGELLVGITAAFILISAFGFNFYLLARDYWKKRARMLIEAGVKNGAINWSDIMHIAERWSQDRTSLLFILRTIHCKAVSGEDSDLAAKIDKIRGFLNWNEEESPFVELPENITLQLNSITTAAPVLKPQIRQLAISMSDLYEKNRRDLRRSYLIGFWSLVVGIVGLFFAAATFLPKGKQTNLAGEPTADPVTHSVVHESR
jgi:hypothetical protein